MRRPIVLLTVLGITLLGLVAVTGPAQAASLLGANGKIAFNRDPHGATTVDPDGSHEHKIGAGELGVSEGAWSPDSSRLLLVDFATGFARPATANPDGSGLTLLDAYPNLQQHLGCNYWSPDATRFLCSSNENPNPDDNGV
jgi:hypothetical protein